MLQGKETLVVPDILANTGGVVASYFEWIQGRQQYFWDTSEVHVKLERVMKNAFAGVSSLSQEKGVTLRDAALMLAVE